MKAPTIAEFYPTLIEMYLTIMERRKEPFKAVDPGIELGALHPEVISIEEYWDIMKKLDRPTLYRVLSMQVKKYSLSLSGEEKASRILSTIIATMFAIGTPESIAAGKVCADFSDDLKKSKPN